MLIILNGCGSKNDLNYKNSYSWDDGTLEINVHGIKTFEGRSKTFPNGIINLNIKNKDSKKINLTCISISVNNIESTEIYVDSIASILASEFQIKNKNMKIPVYWEMSEQITADEFKSGFEIIIKENCELLK